MDRTTRAQLESAFTLLAAACGKLVALSDDDIGMWRIDRYNGFVIEEVTEQSFPNVGRVVKYPFGPRRHNMREMYDLCKFGFRAIEISTEERTK